MSTDNGSADETPASPPEAPKGRRVKLWTGVSGMGVIVLGLTGFLGNVAGIGSLVRDVAQDAQVGSTATSIAQSTTQPPGISQSVPAPAPAAVSSALAPGSCVDAAGLGVSCDVPHFAEVIAPSAGCSAQMLVEYAGGIPHTDVLREDLTAAPLQAIGCAAIIPSGLTARVQDGLNSAGHVALRRCQDVNGRSVGCDQVHVSEFVYDNPGAGPESISCSAKADTYVDGTYSRHSTKLDAVLVRSGDSASCLVEAKGSNQLVGSLRRLGTSALPLRPL